MGQYLLPTCNLYLTKPNAVSAMSTRIKETVRNGLSPKVLWNGEVDVNKMPFFMEVHEQYGPSLSTIFRKVSRPTHKELLHLML